MSCRLHNPSPTLHPLTTTTNTRTPPHLPSVTITKPACTCIPSYSPRHQSSFHTFPFPHQQQDKSDKKEDLMDKDSINTTSSEYSKTGAGDGGAAHEEGAFDPGSTNPEDGPGAEQNPTSSLNVSPGNKDMSKHSEHTKDAERSEAETAGGRKSSGGGLGAGKGGRQPGR
ncbi:MAG: hypothetical protein M1828_006715 [Chrysothrix sp. TS-e1954]|nr:MAG: hypothetical protein M1828_006715 [Chrysothrix sp. TS-e1954]